jgi:DNA-binding FadR family transcriptional regulator
MVPQNLSDQLSPFFKYLANHSTSGTEALPNLVDIAKNLGVSVSTLREELEVAKAIGLVDVKPRVGIKGMPYSFTPAVSKSLAFAVCTDKEMFKQFSDLRNHVEASYWYQAVSSLTANDVETLQAIVKTAFKNCRPTRSKYPIENIEIYI